MVSTSRELSAPGRARCRRRRRCRCQGVHALPRPRNGCSSHRLEFPRQQPFRIKAHDAARSDESTQRSSRRHGESPWRRPSKPCCSTGQARGKPCLAHRRIWALVGLRARNIRRAQLAVDRFCIDDEQRAIASPACCDINIMTIERAIDGNIGPVDCQTLRGIDRRSVGPADLRAALRISEVARIKADLTTIHAGFDTDRPLAGMLRIKRSRDAGHNANCTVDHAKRVVSGEKADLVPAINAMLEACPDGVAAANSTSVPFRTPEVFESFPDLACKLASLGVGLCNEQRAVLRARCNIVQPAIDQCGDRSAWSIRLDQQPAVVESFQRLASFALTEGADGFSRPCLTLADDRIDTRRLDGMRDQRQAGSCADRLQLATVTTQDQFGARVDYDRRISRISREPTKPASSTISTVFASRVSWPRRSRSSNEALA